jgi:hypothetical protein
MTKEEKDGMEEGYKSSAVPAMKRKTQAARPHERSGTDAEKRRVERTETERQSKQQDKYHNRPASRTPAKNAGVEFRTPPRLF